MAAAKKHRGLGRGLDALIPAAEPEEKNDNTLEDVLSDGANGSSADHAESDSRENNGIRNVRITLVEPDRSQPRKKFDKDKLQSLADSIKSKGLLEPILVREKGNRYEIIAGERRWRACKLAGLKEIPVIVKNYDDLERVEVSLIENIQREDLNPIEEAKAYQRLIDEFHLKQDDIAEKVSKDRSSIANSMRLLKLSEEVQNRVAAGALSMGQARALIPVEDETKQIELADKIAAENLSVREVERLVRNLSKETRPKKEKDPSLEAIYRDIESKMNSSLGMKVAIKSKGKKSGNLEISFSSQEDLEKLMDKLMG